MESIHDKVSKLLPWYVNGSLSAHETEELESHLRDCLICRSALREEHRIQGMIQQQDDVPLTAAHGIGDLLGQIDGQAVPRRRLRPQIAVGVAVAAAVVFTFVTLFPDQIADDSPDGSVEVPFSTLTEGEAGANLIDIVFADSVSDAEIQMLMQQLRIELISGPSNIGRYTFGLPADSTQSAQDVIDNLASDSRIRFVGRNYQ